MSKALLSVAGLFIIIVIGHTVIVAQPATGSSAESMKAPIAKKEPKVLKIHGYEVVDNYAWLRDRNKDKDPAIIQYLKDNNAYTESFMGKHQPLATRSIRRCSAASNRMTPACRISSAITGTSIRPRKGSSIPFSFAASRAICRTPRCCLIKTSWRRDSGFSRSVILMSPMTETFSRTRPTRPAIVSTSFT